MPPEETLPLGQRYADQPEGEIADGTLPLSKRVGEAVVHGAMGLPRPGASRADWMMAVAPYVIPMGRAGYLAKTLAHPPQNMMTVGADAARMPPTPSRLGQWLGEKLTKPEDRALYDVLMDEATKRTAQTLPDMAANRPAVANQNLRSELIRDVMDFREFKSRTGSMSGNIPKDYHPWLRAVAVNDPKALRNVDWGLTAMQDASKGAPLDAVLARDLGYQGAKWAAQKWPNTIGRYLDRLATSDRYETSGVSGGGAFTLATPPDWQSFLWGLRPFWANR